jgi:hypothetical protein
LHDDNRRGAPPILVTVADLGGSLVHNKNFHPPIPFEIFAEIVSDEDFGAKAACFHARETASLKSFFDRFRSLQREVAIAAVITSAVGEARQNKMKGRCRLKVVDDLIHHAIHITRRKVIQVERSTLKAEARVHGKSAPAQAAEFLFVARIAGGQNTRTQVDIGGRS